MCLAILEGKEIDRVYCDYHDDFVVRKLDGEIRRYHFYQVKTKRKRNHQWDLTEVFGLKKRGQKFDGESLRRIRDSFAGKMLRHTISFTDACTKATLLTNIHFSDDIEKIIFDLNTDPKANAYLEKVIAKFQSIFELNVALPDQQVVDSLKKLEFEPGVPFLDLEGTGFTTQARDALFKHSEIELRQVELERIVQDLIALVAKKSFQKVIAEVTEQELDEKAGVGIDDLLEILSISKGVYKTLLAGGDPYALKSASILQRKLKAAGAGDQAIEYCSSQKVNWDIWFRDKRHVIPEFDFNFLLEEIDDVHNAWASAGGLFADLKPRIESLYNSIRLRDWSGTLSRDLLLGGVFASLVRREAQ